MATTLKELQKKLDDRSLNPNELSREQRAIIDELINRGELKGPSMRDLTLQRDKACKRYCKSRSILCRSNWKCFRS